MSYRHLPYEKYFLDTSRDYNSTGRATCGVEYVSVPYRTGGLSKLFGIEHEANYAVLYDGERDVIQLHFQWTVGFHDWFANVFEFSDKYYDAIRFGRGTLQLRVHHGWGDMYKAIKHRVRGEWKALIARHPRAETEIIGWSLGSAIAILCAQDLNYNFKLRPRLFTYGSVKPFKYTRKNKEQTLAYLSGICKTCMNFADINDIIAYMPPFYGFTAIRTVFLAGEKRTLKRLFKPLKYHTHYDRAELYNGLD